MGNPKALFSVLESELRDQGFDLDCSLPPFAHQKWVAAQSLHRSFLKKYEESDTVPDHAQSRALLTFLESCSTASKWRLDEKSFIDRYVFDDVRFLLYRFWEKKVEGVGNPPLPLFTIQDLGENLRPGPGASVMAKGNDFYTKLFASPLSSSSASLTVWYRRLIDSDKSWSRGEDRRLELYGSEDSVVQGSHLSVVPKNNETGRCICTEPSINMLFQLSAGVALEKRLKEVYGIGLETEPFKNQALSRAGSRSGNYATVDLKSASDSLSLLMLEAVLPTTMFRELCRLRSPQTRIPGLGWFDLPIISTMGNGYTFPLQTILFTCIVHACYRLHDIPLVTGPNSNFGVFGDDIVVDVAVYRTLMRALDVFGFTVNDKKSFSDGLFRESCGCDYYLGHNVRGFFLKRLTTQQDYYVAINRLTEWSSRTGIYLPKTVNYLLTRCKWVPVPLWENDDAGIKVPYSMVVNRLRFCRFEQSPLYKYYSAIPLSIEVGEGDLQENPEGALVALLKGVIRGGRVTKRCKRPRYVLNWNTCPQWDMFPEDCASTLDAWSLTSYPQWDDIKMARDTTVSRDFLVQRWNTAAALNLF